jgi:hypothetical protein
VLREQIAMAFDDAAVSDTLAQQALVLRDATVHPVEDRLDLRQLEARQGQHAAVRRLLATQAFDVGRELPSRHRCDP